MQYFCRQYQFFLQLSGILWLVSLTTIGAFAAESSQPAKIYVSANEKVSLIELYTSEGCSSCPPADAWLSRLKSSPALFTSLIPLAFHVDYWNYLGWKDPFATSKNSRRQRLHKQQGHTNAIYTPGFVIDGQEWRGFFDSRTRSNPPIASENNGLAPGKLKLTHLHTRLSLDFMPLDALDMPGNQAKLTANFVYLGTDIENPVRGGENRGKLLLHDFVVLSHTYTTKTDQANRSQAGTRTWRVNIKMPPQATAVAAWISATDNLTPIQAVGGWL